MTHIKKYYKDSDEYIECHIDNAIDREIVSEVLRSETLNILYFFRSVGWGRDDLRGIFTFSDHFFSNSSINENICRKISKNKVKLRQSPSIFANISNLITAGCEITLTIKRGNKYMNRFEDGKKIYEECPRAKFEQIIIPSKIISPPQS